MEKDKINNVNIKSKNKCNSNKDFKIKEENETINNDSFYEIGPVFKSKLNTRFCPYNWNAKFKVNKEIKTQFGHTSEKYKKLNKKWASDILT